MEDLDTPSRPAGTALGDVCSGVDSPACFDCGCWAIRSAKTSGRTDSGRSTTDFRWLFGSGKDLLTDSGSNSTTPTDHFFLGLGREVDRDSRDEKGELVQSKIRCDKAHPDQYRWRDTSS